MRLNGIIGKLQAAGMSSKKIPVFLLLREMTRGNEDCRAAAASRSIAEEFECWSYSYVYRCIKEFVSDGWLSAETKSREYTMIKVGPSYRRLFDETESETAFETAISSKKQHKSNRRETRTETESETTGVAVAVSRSSPAFDVSASVVSIKKEKAESASPTAPSPVEKFKDDYNRLCPRLIRCRALNDKRRKKIRAELVANPGSSYWTEVFTVANKSAFLAGDNDRKWRADIDFVVREHLAIVEGKYSRPAPYSPTPPREVAQVRPPEIELTETPEEAAERHRMTVKALGPRYCREANCEACGKRAAPPGVTLTTADELEELPV
jgi:hypothetical protein